MTRRRLTTMATATLAAAVATLSLSSPADAVTTTEKLTVLSSWTQTSSGSYHAWLPARGDQAAWAAYAFDWSTDYCSDSPDNPLGFDFTLSCARHDFGYRNYKAMGSFSTNKPRLDDAFYADLQRECATYATAFRPACDALAWTYYQAVRIFGSVVLTTTDLDRAAALLPSRTSG